MKGRVSFSVLIETEKNETFLSRRSLALPPDHLHTPLLLLLFTEEFLGVTGFLMETLDYGYEDGRFSLSAYSNPISLLICPAHFWVE